ncbi:hypothetical protein HMPREF3151_03370 [Corynebacterium sp. HMSC05H05]|nr:hypothetical protein HMPREF3151_03370 [Corynebacterium sp. HMSC05H05]
MRLIDALHEFNDTVRDVLRFRIVKMPSALYQRSVPFCAHQKPGINRDAVSANPGTGFEDVHTRMLVRQFAKFPNINFILHAEKLQLIRERNIHIPKCILC